MGMTLDEQVQRIERQADLIQFVRALAVSAQRNRADWHNCDLATYLDALAAWVEDTDGYARDVDQESATTPTWRRFGEALLAARVYE